MKYTIRDILIVRDHEESWYKTDKIVSIWKRKVKLKVVYSRNDIINSNEEDES